MAGYGGMIHWLKIYRKATEEQKKEMVKELMRIIKEVAKGDDSL